MRRLLIFLMAMMPIVGLMAKTNKEVVVLSCDLHCQGCCDKIMKNIAVPTLLKAFEKIGKPATVKESASITIFDFRYSIRD